MLLIKLLFDVSAPRGQVVKGVSSVFWMLYLNLCCVMYKCFCVVPSPHPAYFLPSWKGINFYTTSLTLRFTQHRQWIKCFLLDRTQRVSIDE